MSKAILVTIRQKFHYFFVILSGLECNFIFCEFFMKFCMNFS